MEKEIKARLGGTFSNIFFESDNTDDETRLTAKVADRQVAEVLITLRDDNVLLVRAAVSRSVGSGWDASTVGSMFANKSSDGVTERLVLLERSSRFLVFATPDRKNLIAVPCIRLESDFPPHFDVAVADRFIRLTAVLTWSDAVYNEDTNLRRKFASLAAVRGLSLHELTEVVVSLEAPGAAMPVAVWRNPSIREPIEIVARTGEPTHSLLDRLARNEDARAATRITVQARVVNSPWVLTYSEPAFPRSLPIEIVLR